ncbi:hypothetical protein [Clostridium neonatale]|uniref:hypothetical protein n=1 Tax=Clostridium neonatale TaxID=137838 RepID=UPI00291C4549|nr:hypothetical protein [Clostridium neonatale]CAI3206570.1 conserved hypothetical protein [Clostridium neonatale]CAI3210693.1 conserved hypothetical protein [Clostridium neonatale]
MTFTEYLKYKEGFRSKAHYYSFLETLPREGQRKVNMYYRKNYRHFINDVPQYEQLKLL